ncbi:MAG: NUDIX domain-containing protein [Bacteroidota bacterium]
MNFTQKVYYNDKPIVLTTDAEGYISSNAGAEHYQLFSGAVLKNFTQAVQQLDKPGMKGVIIEDATEEALREQLHIMYQPIDAGGGLVYNEQNEVLLIYRRGKWDLPKGKLDEGEQIDACALREVTEETGLDDISLGDKVCDTYHIYSQNGEELLKHTVWYKMSGSASQKLKPQKEENIMEARWVKEQDLAPLMAKSYEAIREVMRAAGLKW